MNASTPEIRLAVVGGDRDITLRPERLVIAGYTGRHAAAVQAHIDELAAVGVPRPASVPAFYDLPPRLLTTDTAVEVAGPATSGEVEPVLVRHAGQWYLGLGSDHTDRELERGDMVAAKAACPKPIGGSVLPLDGLDWDAVEAICRVDGRVYQRGMLATLRTPEDLLARLAGALGEPPDRTVVYAGTFPLATGEFVYGASWQLQLCLGGEVLLTHSYEIKRSGTEGEPDPVPDRCGDSTAHADG